ncbi:hypothetical protein J437_LFUL003815 [Ladona fulva]|uniref:Uncharacterized protein n=1 Tax=Ladona fulva TaxID=123851 RepID=A0A8K0KHE9_LADFU|nr:hypothetical protein J437_LFUL003815 [Ladona fulva]
MATNSNFFLPLRIAMLVAPQTLVWPTKWMLRCCRLIQSFSEQRALCIEETVETLLLSTFLSPSQSSVYEKIPLEYVQQLIPMFRLTQQVRNWVNKQGGALSLLCKDCNAIYIGQTGRNIMTWVNEHRKAFENNSSHSHFGNHLLEKQHSSTFTPSILQTCEKSQVRFPRKVPYSSTQEAQSRKMSSCNASTPSDQLRPHWLAVYAVTDRLPFRRPLPPPIYFPLTDPNLFLKGCHV